MVVLASCGGHNEARNGVRQTTHTNSMPADLHLGPQAYAQIVRTESSVGEAGVWLL